MKLITARIEPHRLESVHGALAAAGVPNLTATEVRSFAAGSAHTEVSRGSRYQVNFMPMIRVDVMTEEEKVSAVVDIIREAGSEGAGQHFRIWVVDATVMDA